MSIRITALCIFVAFLAIYAWKDWFKSLCGLILLMAFIEHEDMPKSIFGIQGLNAWNILFGVIFLAWFINRHREGLKWDMPRHFTILLFMYFVVILIGVFRAVFDRSYIEDYPLTSLISEELINTVKWVLPGLLLFDGCRTRNRAIMALGCLLILYFLVSVQVARCMPPGAVFGDSGIINHARNKLDERVGYSAADISVMLGGACWGIMAVLQLLHKNIYKLLALAAAGVVAYGQALTGGRAGYVAWVATGLFMCMIKWRKYLILAPVVAIILPVLFPGAAARMLAGFGQTSITGETFADDETITSGRTLAWPYVIDKIYESPWIGYGRLAMNRTGLQQHIGDETGDYAFPHPHNMYLETLLDNGILGSIPILLFWMIIVIYSACLFKSGNRLYSAIGGLSFALAFTSLFAGIGGQHFYPQEHTFGIWAALFISLRVYVEEKQVRIAAINVVDDGDCRSFGQYTDIASAYQQS